jgi:hypothetical protein
MNLGQILTQLIAIVKADAAKSALPLLATFFTSIAGNPTAINIAAQLAKLEVGLLAALPGIEQDVLKEVAAIVSAEAQAALGGAPPA